MIQTNQEIWQSRLQLTEMIILTKKKKIDFMAQWQHKYETANYFKWFEPGVMRIREVYRAYIGMFKEEKKNDRYIQSI